MFDVQYSLWKPCETVTRELFYRLIRSREVVENVNEARYYQGLMDKNPSAGETQLKEWEKRKQEAKRRIPGLLFQATVEKSVSKNGVEGRWRKKSACRLNGLFILDVDHLDEAEMERLRHGEIEKLFGELILLAFVTASGHGMKFVGKTNHEIGGIAENQRWLAEKLGVKADEACKDESRLSFCPREEDIVYISDEIFNYNNEPAPQPTPKQEEEEQPSTPHRGAGELPPTTNLGAGGPTWKISDDEYKLGIRDSYNGVPYEKIYARYCAACDGEPQVGQRHDYLLRTALGFRHICDFNKDQLLWVLRNTGAGKSKIADGQRKELEDIADAAVGYKDRNYASGRLPEKIRMACEDCGLHGNGRGGGDKAVRRAEIDYGHWWRRLQPLLHEGEGYTDAVRELDPLMRLGGVLSSGAMFGTWLSRTWFRFYDGREYRLSYIVYVIGDPASGKSFIVDQDEMIMKVMVERDEVYRKAEEKWEEGSSANKQSKGVKPEDVEKRPHFPIRYLPTSTSNKVFYRRLKDAKHEDDEESAPRLHLYTIETELATALRSQVGSWAGKLDFELKSFQNEKAGVDYANEGSANGLVRVNWNQVISTTMESVVKKMRIGGINDGYITRLAIWWMPKDSYKMIENRYDIVEKELATVDESGKNYRQRLEEWGPRLDKINGFLPCRRLVMHCYEWCARQTELAELEDDYLTDYFRKRIPLYMIRYTLPKIVMREIDRFGDNGRFPEGEELNVTDEDLRFAELIGDYLLFISIYIWGAKLEEAFNNVNNDLTPREQHSRFHGFFDSLPKEFGVDQFAVNYRDRQTAYSVLSRLVRNKVIERTEVGKYRKVEAHPLSLPEEGAFRG